MKKKEELMAMTNSSGRLVCLEDGTCSYNLDQLESEQLLDDLKDWDYPIFDLLDRYGDRILSAVRYVYRAR